ncbi:MAG: S-methyl-5-thioribose-1-phosphate isomerase [Planctomycetes bacterium]|nr:S-methyl-5-thioribose-1-phosphate isomerase [Planctomycetota bacterium]
MSALAPIPPTLTWRGDAFGHLDLLDQTRLPHERVVLRLTDVDAVVEAIATLRVRGAPAIGVAAAFGLVLGVRALNPLPQALPAVARDVAMRLAAARPTAVNLRWALDQCLDALRREATLTALFRAAEQLWADEVATCDRIGAFGAPLVPDGGTVLTHCNAGRLATVGCGTALGVLFTAWNQGKRFRVLATETRPLLQGARLTALELAAAGIPVELCPDSAAAGLIASGAVQMAVVGADRIAANGDVANKVGTYSHALACFAHRVPFWVAAPRSTFDLRTRDGSQIPIEERDGTEVTQLGGVAVAAPGVAARNPAFDVTPARLLRGIITDGGLVEAPFEPAIKALFPAGR